MSEEQGHFEAAIEWPAGAVAFTVTLENGERVRFVRDAAADIGPRSER